MRAQVTLEHQTGTRESWLRLNKDFFVEIRRHFLHRRAVSPAECEELADETREWMRGNASASNGSKKEESVGADSLVNSKSFTLTYSWLTNEWNRDDWIRTSDFLLPKQVL